MENCFEIIKKEDGEWLKMIEVRVWTWLKLEIENDWIFVDFREWLAKRREEIRPWGTFVKTTSFEPPSSLPKLTKRVYKNVEYFQSNYVSRPSNVKKLLFFNSLVYSTRPVIFGDCRNNFFILTSLLVP